MGLKLFQILYRYNLYWKSANRKILSIPCLVSLQTCLFSPPDIFIQFLLIKENRPAATVESYYSITHPVIDSSPGFLNIAHYILFCHPNLFCVWCFFSWHTIFRNAKAGTILVKNNTELLTGGKRTVSCTLVIKIFILKMRLYSVKRDFRELQLWIILHLKTQNRLKLNERIFSSSLHLLYYNMNSYIYKPGNSSYKPRLVFSGKIFSHLFAKRSKAVRFAERFQSV